MKMIRQLYRDTSGATMVEYGLMLALIALISMLAVQNLGSFVARTFSNPEINTALGG